MAVVDVVVVGGVGVVVVGNRTFVVGKLTPRSQRSLGLLGQLAGMASVATGQTSFRCWTLVPLDT